MFNRLGSDNLESLKYKQKPLYRLKDVIYYGNPEDKYILKLEILKSNLLEDIEMSTKISVKILLTGTDVVIKSAERDNLYSAIDLGEFWLTELLEDS